MQHVFLAEIGSEELPPKFLRFIAQSFLKISTHELKIFRIKYKKIMWFATPRRIAIQVIDINLFEESKIDIKKGPSIKKSFDVSGNPTIFAKNWAKSCGITLDKADFLIKNNKKWLCYKQKLQNEPIKNILFNIIKNVIKKLTPNLMIRWGDKDYRFIRPIHTVTLMLDDYIIPGTIMGIPSNRRLLGHRFMGKSEINLDHANNYSNMLYTYGYVIADYNFRKKIIKTHITNMANKVKGWVYIYDNLLEEVTSLVEWPVVLLAQFKKRFLKIPYEILITIIQNNLKYFAIHHHNGKLLSYFIIVANIISKKNKNIIMGYEKVLHYRLTDAEFFLSIDNNKKLEEHLSLLKSVMFQHSLGTLLEKSHRLEILSSWIARKIGTDISLSARAGLLSKCDLVTNMVCEFSDTQGIIGMYYAIKDGESEKVALAIKEQYFPRYSEDKQLPTTLISCCLAIADRIDTIIGMVGIGLLPKSNKDPFSLRRATIGIIRIILEHKLPLNLFLIISKSISLYDQKFTNFTVISDVIKFIYIRLQTLYQSWGYNIDIIKSVVCNYPPILIDVDARIKAVDYFYKQNKAHLLISLNKRVVNIINKSHYLIEDKINISLLQEPAEITLTNCLQVLQVKVDNLLKQKLYKEILIELITLCEPVDTFFNNVQIMVNNSHLRINRLTILSRLHNLLLKVANISLLT